MKTRFFFSALLAVLAVWLLRSEPSTAPAIHERASPPGKAIFTFTRRAAAAAKPPAPAQKNEFTELFSAIDADDVCRVVAELQVATHSERALPFELLSRLGVNPELLELFAPDGPMHGTGKSVTGKAALFLLANKGIELALTGVPVPRLQKVAVRIIVLYQ